MYDPYIRKVTFVFKIFIWEEIVFPAPLMFLPETKFATLVS